MAALASTAQSASKAGEVEDGELVRRVRRGDERAFEQLYHRYNRRITAYIHGMVHDHARAEDVAQDVFVSALRRMRDTDRPIAFKPWIYEIAKNACIDQFRRSRRAEEVSYDADEGLGAADYGRLVSADAMPEHELESKQAMDHLRGAFGGLSETHHEILVMRELEGLSYREIGERLGMSRPSVESTLFRARRRLTEEYDELVSGARCQRIQTIIAGAPGTGLGARDQRRLARHVSHCQPCRRQARLAGLDIPVTPDRPVRQRIAAVLPLPLFLRRRWLGDSTNASSVDTSHLSGFAQWSAQLGSAVDPGWLKAAATAATVALAGAGAGLAGNADTPTSPVGSFSQLVSGLDTSGGSDTSDALVARTTPGAAAALAADGVTTLGTFTVAAPGRADRVGESVGAGGSTTTSANGGDATSPVGTDAGAGVDQVTANLPGSDPSSLEGTTNASGAQGGTPGTPGATVPSAPDANLPTSANVDRPGTPSAPSTPPAPSTPDASSAPDPTSAVGGAAGTAGGAAGATGVVAIGG